MERFAVLQRTAGPLPEGPLAEAFATVPGLARFDARLVALEATGVIFDGLDLRHAEALMDGLSRVGIEALLVPQDALHRVPPPVSILLVTPHPGRLRLQDGAGFEYDVDPEDVLIKAESTIAHGSVKQLWRDTWKIKTYGGAGHGPSMSIRWRVPMHDGIDVQQIIICDLVERDRRFRLSTAKTHLVDSRFANAVPQSPLLQLTPDFDHAFPNAVHNTPRHYVHFESFEREMAWLYFMRTNGAKG